MNYHEACSRFGLHVTKRGENKWLRGEGLPKKLAAAFPPSPDTQPPTKDEIKQWIDQHTKPGPRDPNTPVPEKKKFGSRKSRKEARNRQRQKAEKTT